MSVTLSISIPTYNRVSLLRQTITALIAQIDLYNLHEEVEMVVSDNCSSDETENYLNSLVALGKYKVVYNRNKENLGVIKNILRLIECSSGKYWMFYGDDDIIPEGQLPVLLDNFKQNADYNTFMFRWKADDYCRHLKDRTPITFLDLGRDFFYYVGNAGIFAVKTEYAKKVVENCREDLINTCWPQTMVVFMSIHYSENRSLLYRDIISSKTPEIAIIRSNSYYLFETALYALLRTAISIENLTKEPFIELAKKSIDGIKYFEEHKNSILENYLYFDSEKQKSDFRDAVKDAHKNIPLKDRREIDFYYKVIKSWSGFYIFKFYILYLRKSLKRNIKTSLFNRLKIYSPLGYYRLIAETRLNLKNLKKSINREEVSVGSGYF